jgi:hypothetical protein
LRIGKYTHWRFSIALIAIYLLKTIVLFALFLSRVGGIGFHWVGRFGLSGWAWTDVDEPTDV